MLKLNRKFVSLTLILIAVIGVQSSLYIQLQSKYNTLQADYAELTSNYDTLNASYTNLNTSYYHLLTQYDDLNESYTQLDIAHDELNVSFYHLQSEYDNLNESYEQLEVLYNDLNTTEHAYLEAYSNLASTVNLHVLHPSSNEQKLITPDDPAVMDKVQEITGGWSDTTDWDEFWSDVKKMYDWIRDNITYRYDGLYPILPNSPTQPVTQFDEMWQFPNQTLNLEKGDCDDMAILLASMIYSYNGKQHWVEVIVITQHAAVYLPVSEDKICILDPSGNYYTNTGSPSYSITSKDIQQEVNAWLDHWTDSIESPIVEWIFSAYIWKEFWSTDEFINWLYDRV